MAAAHLNYCRQMVRQFSDTIKIPSLREETRRVLGHAIDLSSASQKFLLPPNGRIYDDPDYRALDENEPLRLPFPFIALEFSAQSDVPIVKGQERSSKRIVFARERDDCIAIQIVYWHDAKGLWLPMPECALRLTGYIDRDDRKDGYACIKAICPPNIPASDFSDELGALLCFLNTIQCSNVHAVKSFPNKPGKRIKSALPFDEYHILMVESSHENTGLLTGGGAHRSPREHLRRGHIRRLVSGRKIWVNAAVVGAGKGAGKIKKDYQIN